MKRRRSQRGIVLLIALGVMVLLALAGAALTRAVDTVTAVTGNLGSRDAAVALAAAAMEDAFAALYETAAIPERERDSPARGYYAVRAPGEDVRGVPLLLQAS